MQDDTFEILQDLIRRREEAEKKEEDEKQKEPSDKPKPTRLYRIR